MALNENKHSSLWVHISIEGPAAATVAVEKAVANGVLELLDGEMYKGKKILVRRNGKGGWVTVKLELHDQRVYYE
jgi:hypothetical protein